MSAADEDVQLLQSVDGVRTIIVLAFKVEIDDPKRFENSKAAAAFM